MSGSPILALVFIGAFIYAVITSKRKVQTLLFTLGAMVAVFLVGLLLSWIMPRMAPAIGTATGLIVTLTGTIEGIVHARGTLK